MQAPIWAIMPMYNQSRDAPPLRLLSPMSQDLWPTNEISKVCTDYRTGRGLEANQIPSALWFEREYGLVSVADMETYLETTEVFLNNSLVFLSERVASQLNSSGMTGFKLHRIPVLYPDKVPRFSVCFHLLEFSEKKETVLRDATERCRPIYKKRPDAGYELSMNLDGRDVFVDRSALGGVDIWFDTMISGHQFVSNAMAKELTNLGLAQAFRLHQCRFLQS